MGKIFYLMGKSASGKDTIHSALLEDRSLDLKRVVLYTTRPRRKGETEGIEYHFVIEEQLSELESENRIIEVRHYDTVHGIWSYATVDDGSLDTSDHNYLAIGTLESYVKLRNHFGEDKVFPLYIEVEDGIRLRRALDREMKQEHPRYQEMCRRFLADSEDFSEEKLSEAGIERRFLNTDLDKCIDEIKLCINKGL
ncbi:MAG: guanylate kinase [Clostridiales bacterium]|nr:guanylate kinase [Clostridiales bacterium]